MSNYSAITGSSKIINRNSGGGSKLQGIPSSTNLNTWSHVAFRNRNVVCPCNRNFVFCMNQLGGVGAGGIPGRSYAFAPSADGKHNQYYCGHIFSYHLGNNKHLIYPKKDKDGFTVIAKYPSKIVFSIYFNNIPLLYSNNKNISNGTIYKLKGANIKETIFRVDRFNENLSAHYPYYFYNITFAIPNINSGKIYHSRDELLFELSIKN